VNVLLDNKKITKVLFIKDGMHILGYDKLDEVFFDVFNIQSCGVDLIKEKKGDFEGNPIIELDLSIDNKIYKNARFILKNDTQTFINPNLLDYTKFNICENNELDAVDKSLISSNKINAETNIIEKSKQKFFGSIKNELLEHLKNEIKAGIISDLLKNNIQSNFESFLGESINQIKLQKLFQNENNKFRKELIEISEKMARRESIRFSESGGGTNAVQYANGGSMDGDLEVSGILSSTTLSADTLTSNILTANTLTTNTLSCTTLSADTLTTYTLSGTTIVCDNLMDSLSNLYTHAVQYSSGGTINGDLTVNGTLSGTTIVCDNLMDSLSTTYARKTKLEILGDGTNNVFNLPHNLNTMDIGISIYNTNTNELMSVYVKHLDMNTTMIDFITPPSDTDSFYIILIF